MYYVSLQGILLNLLLMLNSEALLLVYGRGTEKHVIPNSD